MNPDRIAQTLLVRWQEATHFDRAHAPLRSPATTVEGALSELGPDAPLRLPIRLRQHIDSHLIQVSTEELVDRLEHLDAILVTVDEMRSTIQLQVFKYLVLAAGGTLE